MIKKLDHKIIGQISIVSYGEAILYQTTQFDLTDKLSQIIDAEKDGFGSRIYARPEQMPVMLNLSLIFLIEFVEGFIIYNNIYTNMTTTVLAYPVRYQGAVNMSPR